MNYVLGAGIAGLITGFYKKCPVIGIKEMSQDNNDFPLGPRLLQVNKYTKKLLKDLGLKAEIKTAKIGYFFDNGFHNKCPATQYANYQIKTRGGEGKFKKSAMSDGKNSIDYYDIDMKTIINELYKRVKIIEKTVIKISLDKKLLLLNDWKKISFDKIYNTIPLYIFTNIADIKNFSFKAKDKFFYHVKTKLEVFDNKKYDYVYFTETRYCQKRFFNDITRMTYVADKEYVIETNHPGVLKGLEVQGTLKILGEKCLKSSQIINDYDNKILKFKNAEMVGRFGRWQHKIKIQDVVKQVTKK